MNKRMKIAAPLMLATTAALAATGYTQLQSTETHPYVAPNASDNWVAPAPNEQPGTAANATESMAAPAAAPAPVVEPRAQPPVEITAPRLSEDELLRNAVMDRLASDGLSGKVGVEAYRHTVSLTGRVTTTGQIERAGTLARSVDGVWRVDNYLLARVGMS